MQGRGHGREPVPPEPFTSPFNAVSRLFLEQWVTFPQLRPFRGWRDALRSAQREGAMSGSFTFGDSNRSDPESFPPDARSR